MTNVLQGRPERTPTGEGDLASIEREAGGRIQRSRRRVWLIGSGALIAWLMMIGWAILAPRLGETSQLVFGVLAVVEAGAVVFLLAAYLRRTEADTTEHYVERLRGLALRLQESSVCDSLTGLFNHGYLLNRLQEEISRSSRAGTPLSLVILDLDDFKEINDRQGHLAGDAALKAAADAIRGQVREHDVVARYGGDEFCLVLPETDRSEAQEVVRRVRAAVASAQSDYDGSTVMLSFGCGVAAFPADGRTTEALIASADSQLYEEKQLRRLKGARNAGALIQNLFYRIGGVEASSGDPATRHNGLAEAVCASLALRGASLFWYEGDEAKVQAHYYADLGLREAVERAAQGGPVEMEITIGREAVERNEIVTLEGLRGGDQIPASLAAALPEDLWGQWIPISIENKRSGVLQLWGERSESAPLEAGIARALARLLAGALQNSLHFQEAQRQRDRLAALADVGSLLMKPGPFDQRLRHVAQRVAETVEIEAVTFVTHDPEGKESILTSTYTHRAPHLAEEWERRLGEQPRDFLQQLARAGSVMNEPFVIEEPADNPGVVPFLREIYRRGDIHSFLAVPIRFQDKSFGILSTMSSRRDAFNKDTISLFGTIASQIAPSLESALLHSELQTSYETLREAHLGAMLRLAAVAEARDPLTGGHLHRLRAYTEAIATRLGLDEAEITALSHAAVVHDIGKLRVPDVLLAKSGSLTEDEWALIRKHPAYGEELLGEDGFYRQAREVARWHHERWDGSGYPDGLKGEAIPLGARIVSIADVFDALTTRRPYKVAWPIEKAVEYIRGQRGRHFAPEVVDAFLELAEDGSLEAVAGPLLDAVGEQDVIDERFVA